MVGFVWPLAASSRRAHEQDTREKGICRAVTSFLPPGRPKAKTAPSGGSKPEAQRGGFFSAGPPQGKSPDASTVRQLARICTQYRVR
ncbi:hypothetical protein ANK1_2326 [plant metagenome]|uniref:Uncharacterized protein n=1 Tax=plant metagenome TaxID=1297885 RepID=A0A484PG51_9ZZZZ